MSNKLLEKLECNIKIKWFRFNKIHIHTILLIAANFSIILINLQTTPYELDARGDFHADANAGVGVARRHKTKQVIRNSYKSVGPAPEVSASNEAGVGITNQQRVSVNAGGVVQSALNVCCELKN